ncbi:uncharacterized protein LOC141855085 [Brevipalpus obovatus]|uniref:uncharacterized protein LOC141855085 n=1 Tax=Brevipalpus obovatus TaxID=246614 RepID=UPI003D9EE018
MRSLIRLTILCMLKNMDKFSNKMIILTVMLLLIFDQSNAEVVVNETDLQLICNTTRILAVANLDPISIVEKTSNVLERTFGLHSMNSLQDPMSNNIERMMITALVMEFIPDLAHWKSTCRQGPPGPPGPLNPPGTPQNPIPQDLTYKVDVINKGKAEGGITSSINMLAVQRGALNGFGKPFESETVSLMKLKKSDVTTKFSSIAINTPGTRDNFAIGNQLFNAILSSNGQAANLITNILSVLGSAAGRDILWEEIRNNSALTTALQLDPIASVCRSMKISTPLNSTNPDTWWQGIDSIRAEMATVNIDLSYTRACGTW